jgi:hypothetical protein
MDLPGSISSFMYGSTLLKLNSGKFLRLCLVVDRKIVPAFELVTAAVKAELDLPNADHKRKDELNEDRD